MPEYCMVERTFALTVKHSHMAKRAFTLVELLTVMAIIAILAALLLSVLGRAEAAAQKTTCLNNTRQIDIALLMYVTDHGDAIHAQTNTEPIYFTYKNSILSYLARNGADTNDSLFRCPADNFDCTMPAIQDLFLFDNVKGTGFCRLSQTLYSSYFFNGEVSDSVEVRMAGKPFSAVRNPSRFILGGELSAVVGLSAHERKQPAQFNNAKNVLSFVDGHVAFLPIYWDGVTGTDDMPCFHDPPPGYDYTWYGN
jgi:prepilin-type N-terminal cleavage/methylation domain-containing protein